jgi:putative hydrolase of the HAD superfamily
VYHARRRRLKNGALTIMTRARIAGRKRLAALAVEAPLTPIDVRCRHRCRDESCEPRRFHAGTGAAERLMITAVLFDLDDTLFDHRGCARAALTAVHQSHEGLRTTSLDRLEDAHAEVLEELHQEVMLGRMPLDAARIERFRRLLDGSGAAADEAAATAIATLYRDTYRRTQRTIAGAAELLAALASQARIAVVTNNLRDEQQNKLATCGLDRYIHALVVPDEAGAPKPDPAIFRLALSRLNVLPQNAVMVGDSWQADVVGARAAGIRAIWFNPYGTPAPDGAAVTQLRSLEPADEAARIILDAHRN